MYVLLCVVIYSQYCESSSSTFHHVQVGGPSNKVTTGEIHIDLPSESFHNIKFNITPYSLQSEYSQYYDQYSTGTKYQSTAARVPRVHAVHNTVQPSYKPVHTVQPSYKPVHTVQPSYKPVHTVQPSYRPSTVRPTYSYPQVVHHQPSYTQQPSYIQPKLSYNPTSVIQPSYTPTTHVYQRPVQAYRYNTIKTETKPDNTEDEEEEKLPESYAAYPYPYQYSSYNKPSTEEDADESKEETNEQSRTDTGRLIEEEKSNKDNDDSDAREAKSFDTNIDIVNLNSVVASTTLLPEFIPIVLDDLPLSTTAANTIDSSLVTSVPSTTSSPSTTTISALPNTSSVKVTTPPSFIRRTPVKSFFREITTSSPSISSSSSISSETVTPPGNIGQSILDKMRTASLALLESEDSAVAKTIEDEKSLVSTERIEVTEKSKVEKEKVLEKEINEQADEKEETRRRRKIVKIRKSKPITNDQGSSYSVQW